MTQQTHRQAAALWRAATLLGALAFIGGCGGGGGGGGSDGSGSGGGAGPSQPVETVPDSALSSTSSFLRFIAAWKVDDTVEPFQLGDRAPPADGANGSAVPVGE